jgi:hypothetical protein
MAEGINDLIFSCHNIPPLAELIFNLLNQTGKDN